jgi:hypothetical protein
MRKVKSGGRSSTGRPHRAASCGCTLPVGHVEHYVARLEHTILALGGCVCEIYSPVLELPPVTNSRIFEFGSTCQAKGKWSPMSGAYLVPSYLVGTVTRPYSMWLFPCKLTGVQSCNNRLTCSVTSPGCCTCCCTTQDATLRAKSQTDSTICMTV